MGVFSEKEYLPPLTELLALIFELQTSKGVIDISARKNNFVNKFSILAKLLLHAKKNVP